MDVADYINHIDEIKVKYKDAYQEMKDRICRHDDGNVSKRIVDIVFKGAKAILFIVEIIIKSAY